MRRLVVEEFVTVDGVMEAPGWDEHRSGRNAWALRIQDTEAEAYNQERYFSVDALLFGRKTYQIWAAFWPTMTADQAFAQRINEMPKYVVSGSLREVSWSNSTILGGDLAEEVRTLKEQPGGEILVPGSADLVNALMRHDLVDEYRLLVYPVVLGSGKHLFQDEIETRHLRLVSSRVFGSGIVLLVYQPGEEATGSPYVEAFAWSQEQMRSLQAAQDTTRILTTVLFTDIVDSTTRAAEVGDRTWRQLLDRHDEISRTEVERWHGRYVKGTGDGMLATFDAPTRAVRCAFELHGALAPLGMAIRAAIHTGEVEIREADIGGMGVHIASRMLAEAGPGAVLVTRTVRDLTTGTDLQFRPLGTVGLRSVPGQWELFEASMV